MNRILNLFFFDDDDGVDLRQNRRRPRLVRPLINHFNIFDAINFQARFRITEESFYILLERIKLDLQPSTQRNNPVPPHIQLMVALRFYATGCYFMTAADFCGISEVSTFRIVHRVSPAIATLREEFIKLPETPAEIFRCQAEFFQQSGFIRVFGCMDGTHIPIQSLGGDDAELFRNRKGYFSINVQLVVNARLEIIDIVARWPGSAHHSTIFQHSRIRARLENSEFGNGLLLGDSGYPNLSFLMTPLDNPASPQEVLYNEAQIRTRCTVERAIGVWKRVFAVLSRGFRFHTAERTLNVIIATAVLHNIIRRERQTENDNFIDPDTLRNFVPVCRNRNMHDERQCLIENYFARLIRRV